jgi:hypothetical protein
MTTKSIPACKECRHFEESPDDMFSTCDLYHYETVDYFNGTVTRNNPLALACRQDEKLCGRAGRGFEQREATEEPESFSYREWLKGFFTDCWMF